jgi:GTP cyclohydrolase II
MDTQLPPSSPPPPTDLARMREVHRAITELRRGAAVILRGVETWLILSAETAGTCGLGQMSQLAPTQTLLLLGEGRAQGLLHQTGGNTGRARAFDLPPALIAPDQLHRLADPTLDQIFAAQPQPTQAPADAEPVVQLAKLARLLPAVLAAKLTPESAAAVISQDVFQVAASAIAAYPAASATHLVRVAEAQVPLEFAPDARIIAFRAPDAGIEHLAILVGQPELASPDLPPPLARLHSECFTGDLLGSLRCDCGPQLRGAIHRMGEEGRGVLLYLAQEGRGIGLVNKLRAYTLQDRGLDTLDANRALGWGADERNFLIAATMLRELHIPRIRLLTNNPDKLAALTACGIQIVDRVPHSFEPNGINDDYLATKASRFGHLFDFS